MNAPPFPALRTWYPAGQPIEVHAPLPAGAERVLARSAFGDVHQAVATGDHPRLPGLTPGSYAIEAWSAAGRLLCEELTTVSARPGDRPVPGFVTSFSPDAVPPLLAWLRALRCTTVQFYDWMASYAEPLASTDSYVDRLGRKHSLAAIRQLAVGCREIGATPQAYAPVYAVDPEFGCAHQGWLLYGSHGEPQHLGDLLQITNPANDAWQRHWLRTYGGAADALGFDGFHLDTYGYPRQPRDHAGQPVPMPAAYTAFLRVVRAARPDAVLSFNQVNGEPQDVELAGPPGYRYIEVWPPNDRWRHLDGLLARTRAPGATDPDVLAIYPPTWPGDREDALRTVVLTEAICTTLGSSLLVWGDNHGCLRHPYYPDYQRLTASESKQVVRWHRYALRCRDLFAGGADTSWVDIGDENGAVSVRWSAEGEGAFDGGVLPEPAGRSVYARVVRHEDCIAVSVLDLTGSPEGSWQSPTAPGICRRVIVTVLLEEPGRWTAATAVLGQSGDRFVPVPAAACAHREGSAIEIKMPVAAGWSVLRLRRHAAGSAD
jgi:dextranase